MKEYRVLQNYSHDGMRLKGDVVKYPNSLASKLIEKGLIEEIKEKPKRQRKS